MGLKTSELKMVLNVLKKPGSGPLLFMRISATLECVQANCANFYQLHHARGQDGAKIVVIAQENNSKRVFNKAK